MANRAAQVSVRHRLPRDLAAAAALVPAYLGVIFTMRHGLGVDARAYWLAWDGTMYSRGPGERGAYLYSPAFAQAIWPLAQLPIQAFSMVISMIAAAALWHLSRPLAWAWRLPLLLACTHEVLSGNIFWLLALVAVYGMRSPGLWAVAALTKITPAVGLIWFLVRGEWRKLGIAVGVTCGVILLSWTIQPEEWTAWISLLLSHAGDTTGTVGGGLLPPPAYRIPAAWVLVAWGARHGRSWTIPASMILASPVFGLGSLALLAALPRLRQRPIATSNT